MNTAATIGDLLAGDEPPPVIVKTRDEAPQVAAKVVPAPPPQEEMWTIALEENDGIPPTGQFFSLNGRSWMLRPGEQVRVPVGIINILNDAVMSVPYQDPVTMQVMGYRERLRFPYRVVQRGR